ncbi:MAG: metallophosphoesterase [Actinobacteria bacterium]|nr:metallophosphoesterase [Actinomycetota bacterium]
MKGLGVAALLMGLLGALLATPSQAGPVPPGAADKGGFAGWSAGERTAAVDKQIRSTVTVGRGVKRIRLQQYRDGEWHTVSRHRVRNRVAKVRFRAGPVGVYTYRLRAGGRSSGTTEISTFQRIDTAGDLGSCTADPDKAAGLVRARALFLALGDIAYPESSMEYLLRCYDPHYGPIKDRTLPVIGNHDYYADDGGYFTYFGAAAGTPEQTWYVKDFGSWRLLALDSNCDKVDCTPGSAQYRFVEQATQGDRCLVAAFHHPVWSSGAHGGSSAMSDLASLLRRRGVDLFLSGHDHHYERIQRGSVLQFVVGTGGAGLRPVGQTVAGSRAVVDDRYGILRLELRPGGYAWRFKADDGSAPDEGSRSC